jgi:hypothetical protein
MSLTQKETVWGRLGVIPTYDALFSYGKPRYGTFVPRARGDPWTPNRV